MTDAHDTDSDLAKRVEAGDMSAALELFLRYKPRIARLAARHGNAVAYDREDVSQDCFLLVVNCALESVESGDEFLKVFVNSAGNAIAAEASKYRHPVPIPLTTFRVIHEAVKTHGSPAAAREALAALEGRRRVAPETFDAVWLLAFGVHLDWSSAELESYHADQGAPSAFTRVENADYARYLLELLENEKGPQYREVVARMYGLDGFPTALHDPRTGEFIPATSKIVAAEMGIRDDSVRRIWSKARAFLTIHAEEF